MNLNANPRFEQFDISDDAAVFDVVDGVMAEIWKRSAARPVQKLRHADATAALDYVPDEDRGSSGQKMPEWAPRQTDWWQP
jgi:hypothetical protein